MFQELKEGLCKWSVVSKEQVMLYKFGEVCTAQVMENLMDHSKCLSIKCMCSGRPLKLEYVHVMCMLRKRQHDL